MMNVFFFPGETTTLVPAGIEVEGKVTKIFNHAVPASNGLIYYTDSSTNYYVHEGVGELFGAPSGRVLVYDPAANKSHVLVDGVHFTNGIMLSPNEDYILYSESFQYRIMKYWIDGPKKGRKLEKLNLNSSKYHET